MESTERGIPQLLKGGKWRGSMWVGRLALGCAEMRTFGEAQLVGNPGCGRTISGWPRVGYAVPVPGPAWSCLVKSVCVARGGHGPCSKPDNTRQAGHMMAIEYLINWLRCST